MLEIRGRKHLLHRHVNALFRQLRLLGVLENRGASCVKEGVVSFVLTGLPFDEIGDLGGPRAMRLDFQIIIIIAENLVDFFLFL